MDSCEISMNALFGGIPFLDPEFQTVQFLTAVAVVRRNRDKQNNMISDKLNEYLSPMRATHVYNQILGREGEIAGKALTNSEKNLVKDAINSIIAVMPLWSGLLTLPLEIRRTEDKLVIGYSNASRPQIIMLGPLSWQSEDELREQLLHEIAHIWLYMVEELWALHQDENPGFFTLPSGISGKTGTGVLNASFVAATLLKFYDELSEGWVDRKLKLGAYLSGCLDELKDYTGLTSIGDELLLSIRNILEVKGGGG